MTEQDLLKRITATPGIFSGKPTIPGMRICVELALSVLAQGETAADMGGPPIEQSMRALA